MLDLRSEPCWLLQDEVVALNALVVASTGEPFGVRDRGLLESACGKAEHRWYYDGEDDVAVLACTLLFGIAQNHPFVQGNKRTGFEAAIGFLRLNGWVLNTAADPALGDMIIEALRDDAMQASFAAFIGDMIEPTAG